MLTGRKLLLADDSLTIQKVVSLTFGDEGCVVACVSDGASALDKMEEFEPDVVLADVFMPGLGGYELCERIKENERFRHVPVILLVGTFEPYDEDEARRVGANDVLTKPFQSIRELVGKVGDLLGGKSEQPSPAEAASPETAHVADVYADPILDDEMIEATLVSEPTTLAPEPSWHADPVEAETSFDEATEEKTEEAMTGAANDAEHPYSLPQVELGEAYDEQPFQPDARETPAPETQAPEVKDFEIMTENNVSPQTVALEDFAQVDETAAAQPVAGEMSWDEDLLELGEESPALQASDDFILELDEEPAAEPVSETPEVEPAHGLGHAAAVVVASVVAAGATVAASLIGSQPHGEESGEARAEQGAAKADTNMQTEAMMSQSKVVENNFISTNTVQSAEMNADFVEAVARRVVELMSHKIVEEVAWEVVPQLSELMIKRKLEGGRL